MDMRRFVPGMGEQIKKEELLKTEHNKGLDADKEAAFSEEKSRFDISGWDQMNEAQKRESLQELYNNVKKLSERAHLTNFEVDYKAPDISTVDPFTLDVLFKNLKTTAGLIIDSVQQGGYVSNRADWKKIDDVGKASDEMKV